MTGKWQLAYLARRCYETKGYERQMVLRALREYLRTTPEFQLLEEIEQFGNVAYLRALWSAGLSATLQDAATKRARELS